MDVDPRHTAEEISPLVSGRIVKYRKLFGNAKIISNNYPSLPAENRPSALFVNKREKRDVYVSHRMEENVCPQRCHRHGRYVQNLAYNMQLELIRHTEVQKNGQALISD